MITVKEPWLSTSIYCSWYYTPYSRRLQLDLQFKCMPRGHTYSSHIAYLVGGGCIGNIAKDGWYASDPDMLDRYPNQCA